MSGCSLVLQPYVGKIDTLVATWLLGTEGQGVIGVIFGDYGFIGKLARTWFKSVNQFPMNVGDRHYDTIFPFGFSLTTQENTAGTGSSPPPAHLIADIIVSLRMSP
ncbi:hypothetical protein FXO37_23968 [Capsicum annuum]|nr:hypothetical protein FXO37_23968 [Capsicum annuum]